MNSKFFFLLFLFITFLTFPVSAQKDGKTFKVVIDAGHGGKDPGCLGAYTKENDVALNIALKTGNLISDNCPNVKVIYTRNTDVFVELYRRAKIANDNHADLFISFHCNASENKSAHGIDTWVMGLHKSEANLAVARAENSAMLKEKNYEQNYGGFKNLINTTHLRDRGVNQAGYWVLWAVSMPSILIEMGFLTNPTEEKFLSEEKNKASIADAIYRAFVSYYSQVTGNKVTTPDVIASDNSQTESSPKSEANDHNNNNSSDNQSDKKVDDQKVTVDNSTANPDEIRFMVQFMALPEKISLNDRRFNGLSKVNRYHEGGLWKYTSGSEIDLQSAKKILAEVKKKYPDAFIIAFQGETKIPVSEAVKLVKP